MKINLMDRLKTRNPKLADQIEWTLADAQAKAQASAEYRRQLQQQISSDLER